MKKKLFKFFLFFILTFVIFLQINFLSYAQIVNINDCSSCHNDSTGQFAVDPVSLNNCNVCHSSLLIDTCSNGTVSTPNGYFKNNPPITNGNILHIEHSGIKIQYNDPNCRNCHYQADCSICHTSVAHTAHFNADLNYSSKNLAVADGISVINKDITCANASCHNTSANSYGNNSQVMSINSQSIESTSSIGLGNNPRGIAVNNNTNRIYIANYKSNTISVIDSDTSSINFNKVIDTITVGKNPYDVAVNTNTNIIYVTNVFENTVSIIDGNSGLVVSTINVGIYPKEIEVNSITNKVYVTNDVSSFITVIDANMGNQKSGIPFAGIKPNSMYVDDISNKIYLAVQENNQNPSIKVYDIIVIDGATNAVSGTISNSGISNDLGFNGITNRIYNASKDKIVVIDSNNFAVVKNINFAGSVVTSVVSYPEIERLYAAVRYIDGSEKLHVLNSEGDIYDILSIIPVVSNTQKVRVNRNNGYIYITGGSSTIVTETKPACSNCHSSSDVLKHLPDYHDPNPRQAESVICNSCHNQASLITVHSAYNWSCFSCHIMGNGPNYGSTAVTVINAYKSIINPTYSDKAGCQDCHPTVIGTKGDPASLINMNHAILHDSNPRQTENTVCNSCHSQTNLPAVHKWDCLICHNGAGANYGQTALNVINTYALSNKTYDDKAGCPDCHPTVMGTKGVPASLMNINHAVLHDPNPRQTENAVCNLCHNQTNLPAVHNYDCLSCHNGTGANYGQTALNVINTYVLSNKTYEDKAGCPDCHLNVTGMKGDVNSLQNNSHMTLHNPNPKNYGSVICNLCHSQANLPAIHTAYNKDCLACHQGSGPIGTKAVEAINKYSLDRIEANKAGCNDCHTASVTVDGSNTLQNSNHITLHIANPDQTQNAVCNLCHNQTNLPAVHSASNWDCLACHNGTGPNYGVIAKQVIDTYSTTGKTDNDKAGCQTCHSTVTGTKGNPASLDNANHYALHDPNPRQTENSVCNLCHKGTNLAVEHKNNNWDCAACHLGTGPNSGAVAFTYLAFYRSLPDSSKVYASKAGCQDCHNSVTGSKGNPASLINADHKTLHDPNPRQYNNATCKLCHAQTNLPDVHLASNWDCLACHNGTGPTLGTKAKQVIAAYDTSIKDYNAKAGCQTCHTNVSGTKGNDSSLANSTHVTLHIPNPTTSSGCTCHANTSLLPDLHKNIIDGCLGCHQGTGPKYGSTAVNVINAYRALPNPVPANKAGCIDCHGQQNHTCVTCHTDQKNSRRPITPEFGLASHHVAGSVQPNDCQACHNIDNHGSGTVYLKNLDNTTNVIAYDPNNAASLNPFCLGCHDADSKTSTPFSDGKKTIASGKNWDSTDIDTKYSNTGTADSNKYPPTTTAPGNNLKFNTVPNEKKAYSPHGNPAANQPNGNTSDKPVACYDCHNSHGSSLPTLIKTTDTYTPSSVEDFCWDCHLNDTNSPVKASEYLLDLENNEVRDYYGDSRWGENSGTGFKGDWISSFTYKSGKFMSSHFYPSKKYDSLKTWQRSSVTCTSCHDVHGINSGLVNAKYMVPVLKGTWLVSPYKEDRAPQASYISSMPDDVTGRSYGGRYGSPSGSDIKPRSRPSLDFNNPPAPGAGYANGTGGQGHEGYFIDDNTFGVSGNSGNITVNRISENDSTFAGLCLRCHNQTALKAAWSGHGVVKGWGGATKDIFTSAIAKATLAGGNNYGWGGNNRWGSWGGNYRWGNDYRWGVDLGSQDTNGYIQKDYHQFACSKCHSPHASRLKRLMITDCLDNKGNHSPMANDLNSNANNCHSTQRGAGWDTTIPWTQPAVPVTTATIDNAQLTPSSSNALVGNNVKLTFMAKNNKVYTLDYYSVTFDYNYSGLDITNLACNPPARIAAIDPVNRTITLRWENINPNYVISASFDCKSNYTGSYQITKDNIEYKDVNNNIYYGNCNSAVVNVVNTIPDTQAPNTPSGLTSPSKGRTNINLKWNAATDNAGVTGYNIYKKKSSATVWAKVVLSNVLIYNDTGLTSNTTYNYKVSAYDAAGNESAQSSQLSVTTSRY